MSKFEILCVTMHQNDFSKIREMNIRSDVVFANQCDCTAYDTCTFDGYTAKMISTQTRGVGINRNLSLMYASADICLFADDDVTYCDDMEKRVLSEFAAHPDADIMIFHFETDLDRQQYGYAKTKKCGAFTRMPWAAFRIAFRLSAVRKANLWFTTLFGGGCVFPAGEDSMWVRDARQRGLTIYVSKETIGKVSFAESTWFTGYDEKYYYGQGTFYQAMRPKTFPIWMLYSVLRTRKEKRLSVRDKLYWIRAGKKGYQKMLSYAQYKTDCNQLQTNDSGDL